MQYYGIGEYAIYLIGMAVCIVAGLVIGLVKFLRR